VNVVITEKRGPHATIFTVRNRWEHGTIVVRPLPGLCGAEVLCNSSYGSYAYAWGAMGEDWRSFLADLDFEYAMGKLAAGRFRVPLDHEEFVTAMRRQLAEDEKSILDSWGTIDADQAERLSVCREALDELDPDCPREALFRQFDKDARGYPYAMELYETRLDKPCPQARGFWDKIWTPFMERLAAENCALERRWARELDLAGMAA
jgi:hypothetical protein